MSTQRFADLTRLCTAAVAAVLAVACASPGPSPSDQSDAGQSSRAVILTTRGARITLAGNPTSVANSVEQTFRVLDIDLDQRIVDESGGTVDGQAGQYDISVAMSRSSQRETRVVVQVRQPSGERWDRQTARGILEEIRRWHAR